MSAGRRQEAFICCVISVEQELQVGLGTGRGGRHGQVGLGTGRWT